MKVLVIHNKEINYYPPVKSLVDILLDLGNQVTLVTYDRFNYEKEKEGCSNLKLIKIESFKKRGKIQRSLNVFFMKSKFRRCFSEWEKKHDIVWTTTDSTISLVGRSLLKCNNHVMQLMELVEDAPRFYYKFMYHFNLNNRITIHLDHYARNAKCVVVPEVNRAQITKAMWGLDKLPQVLPNKPYRSELDSPDSKVIKCVENLQSIGKKLILYQGIFHKERKLDKFAEAVHQLGDQYAFCIMGRDTPDRQELCEKYPEIIYVPFIAPPYHLMVTKIAHIGILTYFPTADKLAGKLNVVYCAPNKIYEYAYNGLPMIGNNIPGLSEPFDKYNIGTCFEEMTVDLIIDAVKQVEADYDNMKKSCKMFFDEIDMKKIVEKIIKS